jgi:hypothetical protein
LGYFPTSLFLFTSCNATQSDFDEILKKVS